jgi:hypothetical protein
MASQLPDDLNKQKGEKSMCVREENSERSLNKLFPNDLNDIEEVEKIVGSPLHVPRRLREIPWERERVWKN